MTLLKPPTSYVAGYARAREADPDLADAYIEHTRIGDPPADAAMEALSEVDQATRHRLIDAGMEGDEEGLREAPDALKEFFGCLDPPDGLFHPEKALQGARAFHKSSDMFFVGLVLAAVITGFTTGVSKSFYMTGRTTGNLRRLRQNTRHLIDITLPGGLERFGDGWKLTVRIRLVHAQMRRLLLQSDGWDVAADGVPLHASHLVLAATGFSAVNLQAVRRLGVKLTTEESEGFMHIWRYVTWLIGVPPKILFRGEDDAIHLKNIGYLCEPRPRLEAVSMAHGVVKAVPELLRISDPRKAERFVDILFRTSRALIGHEMADALEYPRQSTFWILPFIRAQRQFQILRSRVVPGTTSFDAENFIGLMERSTYDETGVSYRMPDAVKDTESSRW